MINIILPIIYAGYANKLFVLMTALTYQKRYGGNICGFKNNFPKYLQKFITKDYIKTYNIINTDSVELSEQSKDFMLYGYCQNYNLIDWEYCAKILECPEDVKIKIKDLYGDISDRICLHVRRGDYLSDTYKYKYKTLNAYDVEYIIKKYYPSEKFICISDDIQWCKDNLKGDMIFADKCDDFLVDFYIQTMTKGNICSASSFSIAGACLNPNKNCVVPYPYYKDSDSFIVPSYAKRYNVNENSMKISIVITAYNVGKFIERAVRSVLSQTYKNIEIVIVEDCSTDNTKDIIEQLAKEDDRIKVVHHDENKGAGWGRRDGINACTGDYFITVDGDDWLDETFIESLVKRAEETGADIVSGGITVDKEEGYWEKTCYGRPICEGEDKVIKFWGEKIVFMNNKIIRKELHDKVPYCTRRYIEDTPTIIPMLWFANRVAYTEDTGYHYRMNENSLTHTADTFKTALYRGLCGLDLIDFFTEHDPKLLEKLPLSHMVEQQITIIKLIKPTVDLIKEHMNVWLEFTRKILL